MFPEAFVGPILFVKGWRLVGNDKRGVLPCGLVFCVHLESKFNQMQPNATQCMECWVNLTGASTVFFFLFKVIYLWGGGENLKQAPR